MEYVIMVILVLAFFLYLKWKITKNAGRPKKREKVYKQYNINESEKFVISGYKDEFIIRKNGYIELLVRDGMIIASRDLRVSKKFVYYGGGSNGDR